MAEKKSEVRIPEEHLHLNGKRERAPPTGRTISRFVPSVWVTLMMTPFTYCSGEKDLKRAFLCTVGASIDLLSSALNPLIII